MKLSDICSNPKTTGSLETEFITPKWMTDALGPFDVDVCAARNSYNTIGRRRNYYGPTGSGDCGLAAKLRPKDFVWCNPPFGVKNGEPQFFEKMSNHGNGICISQSKVSSVFFHSFVWPKASGVFFFRGGVTFEDLTGKPKLTFSGALPVVLTAFGDLALDRIRKANFRGRLVVL